jgi:hypothetical protein
MLSSMGSDEDTYEVVLMGMIDMPYMDWYYSMIIERYEGLVRKIGVASEISMKVWLEAKPQLELIFLI